ncbi:unnamed protein product [Choristocarpus tenellus]
MDGVHTMKLRHIFTSSGGRVVEDLIEYTGEEGIDRPVRCSVSRGNNTPLHALIHLNLLSTKECAVQTVVGTKKKKAQCNEFFCCCPVQEVFRAGVRPKRLL